MFKEARLRGWRRAWLAGRESIVTCLSKPPMQDRKDVSSTLHFVNKNPLSMLEFHGFFNDLQHCDWRFAQPRITVSALTMLNNAKHDMCRRTAHHKV